MVVISREELRSKCLESGGPYVGTSGTLMMGMLYAGEILSMWNGKDRCMCNMHMERILKLI